MEPQKIEPITSRSGFLAEPFLVSRGYPEAIFADSMAYITPMIEMTPLFVILQFALGFIQGEGRSIIILIMFFVCKARSTWSGVPYVNYDGMPAMILAKEIGRASCRERV
jgi:hypothetical protein